MRLQLFQKESQRFFNAFRKEILRYKVHRYTSPKN
jgi:hypothetical protein